MSLDLTSQLRVCDQPPHAHPVHLLPTAPNEAAFTGPILIGKRAIGVQMQGQPVGDLLQLIGAQHRRLLSKCAFGFLHLHRRHMLGQVAEELLDHPQMLGVELPGMPGRRCFRQ
jgi:hypothetical protein